MNVTSRWVRFAAACVFLGLGACGGGGGSDGGDSPPPPQAGIGPAGGTVTGPNGAKVVIPPGALTTNVDIRIEQTSVGSPALPGGLSAAGQMFAFTPHGTTFAVPVTVTLPFDPAAVSAGVEAALYKTNGQDQWEQVTSATFDQVSVIAQITSFSFGQPLQPALERRDPYRTWRFEPTDQSATTGPQPNDFGGEIHETRAFGTNEFFSFDDDDTRTLEAFSSADGVTFWVSAEDVGSAHLRQTQKFIKRAENATLQFVVTQALLEARDGNQIPSATECPRGLDLQVCAPMSSLIQFKVEARTMLGELLLDRNGVPALDTSGALGLRGRAESWEFYAFRNAIDTTAAWGLEDFERTKSLEGDFIGAERHPRAKLIEPLVFDVDLSRLDVGDDFRVIAIVFAYAENRRGRESGLGAFVRDPARTGGTAMNFTGLEPVDDASPPASVERPAAPCSTGPDPAAGQLQFSSATYSLLEAEFAGLSSHGIFVTRSGGSTGAVSATLNASGGTATPDVHYTPLSTLVHFGDGDTETRLVELDILTNDDNEPDTTVNLTLSEPGGCATLGAQSSAQLTILDDDRPPPEPLPSGLDPNFGTEGKASSEAFGGDRSAMALQSDGKIVMVGGTFSDFILARFNANGTLDTSFDADGKVTTDMVTDEQEEALGVAIQADGKIVVVGYTGTPGSGGPANFALARYNADGSLDGTFGSGGKVVSGVLGNAYAVAVQPDGRIVVAGEVSIANGADFSNFAVARYNANGTLDAGFGSAGQLTTDFGGGTNTARNIVLQANGAIIVSGEPFGTFAGSDHTDIVRYDANGNPDPSFGTGGKVTLNGARVGEGLALQNDGKLVLAGTIDVTVPPAFPGSVTEFALMRLNANGSPDEAFGTVSTAISDGERDSAKAVALQGDGKIVVAGRSSNTNTDFAVARYNTDGTIDTTFGNEGMLTIDFFGFTDIGESVMVQPDGRIVLGGLARDNVDGYGVARVLP
jgi:uncharacterized delta-60 repeat protein